MSTPEEKQTLFIDRFGIALLVNFAAVITNALLYGAFILLFYTSSASIIRRGLGSRSRQAMFLLTLITFVIATVDLAMGISMFVIEVQSILSRSSDVPLIERLQLSDHSTVGLALIDMWALGILTIISDIVVTWRAWILFFENRWVMLGPLAFLLGTITTSLTSLIPRFNVGVYTAVLTGSKSALVVDNLRTASVALSLATNALSTLMIAYKLWRHRAFLTDMLGPNQPRSRVQNVLIILVESGVLYFVLQLATFLLFVCRGPTWGRFVSSRVFFAIYLEFTAMYPTIVIVLVNHQRSFVDTCGFTNADINDSQPNILARPVTVGHLSIVQAPTSTFNGDLLQTQNVIGQNNTDSEVQVFETRFLKGTIMVEVDVEKRQAKTAPC